MGHQKSIGSKPFRVVITVLLVLLFLVSLAVLVLRSDREPVVMDSFSNGNTNVVVKMIPLPVYNQY